MQATVSSASNLWLRMVFKAGKPLLRLQPCGSCAFAGKPACALAAGLEVDCRSYGDLHASWGQATNLARYSPRSDGFNRNFSDVEYPLDSDPTDRSVSATAVTFPGAPLG